MKKRHIPFLLLLMLAAQAGWAQSAPIIRTYVMQFKDIAIEEMKRTGVPASIKLAQGIHETMAGQSVLVRKSNNHFGIKCKETWTGQSVKHDDDAPQECFRKYDDPSQSYRDHSEFLRTRKHYSALFELDPTDYRGWAHGLKKAGYATNPKYPQIIIKLIEDYHLQDYSLIALGQKTEGPDVLWAQSGMAAPQQPQAIAAVATTPAPQPVAAAARPQYPSGLFRINDTKVIWVEGGTSYLSIAEEHNIPLARLFDFNDLPAQETAAAGGLVYLQRKRKWGSAPVHKVGLGENLHTIAQAEGIRLESLLALNHLEPGMQPEIGEPLYLQEKAPSMPRLMTATARVSLPQLPQYGSGPSAPPTDADGEAFSEHVVQPKETLYAIARRYAVSVPDLMKWNSLEDGNLKSGQLLRIKK